MNPDQEFIKKNFFIITDKNCEHINKSFYGEAIIDNNFYYNDLNAPLILKNDTYGTYINIVDADDKIIIQQDYYGLFGVYLYKQDNKFAISNSFLYLLSYLRQTERLAFDYEYANALLFTWTSLSFARTAIKQIEFVPAFYMIEIDKINKRILKIKIPQNNYTVELNSQKGIKLLDEWHDKWNNIIRSLIHHNYIINVNLSGGRDSRASLSTLFRNDRTSLDTNKICFNSITHDECKEDFLIASEIAKRLNIELNVNCDNARSVYLNNFMSLAISFLTKLSLHNEMRLPSQFYIHTLCNLGGNGGEYLRQHWDESPQEFIEKTVYGANPKFQEAVSSILLASFQNINNEYQSPYGLTQALYECCRGRAHFGLYTQESQLTNIVPLMPLLDPVLEKLNLLNHENRDRNILFALIYSRYLPEIANMNFDSGHAFSKDTREYAASINKHFPYQKPEYERDYNIFIIPRKAPAISPDPPNPRQCLIELCSSPLFASVTKKLFGDELSRLAVRLVSERRSRFLSPLLMAIISTYITFMAISPGLAKMNDIKWIDNLINIWPDCNYQ